MNTTWHMSNTNAVTSCVLLLKNLDAHVKGTLKSLYMAIFSTIFLPWEFSFKEYVKEKVKNKWNQLEQLCYK